MVVVQLRTKKKCTKCRKTKAKTEFYANYQQKDGLAPYCKRCVSLYTKKLRKEGRFRCIPRTSGRKTCTHCRKSKSYLQFYTDLRRFDGLNPYCKSCNRDRWAASRALRMASCRIKNTGTKKCRRCLKRRSVANFSINRSNKDGRYSYCKSCSRIISRESYRKNPCIDLDSNAKRRALIAGVTTEKVERSVVYARDKGHCYICHRKVELREMHLEHVIPIIKGGEHSYNNCRCSCADCNLKKSDR